MAKGKKQRIAKTTPNKGKRFDAQDTPDWNEHPPIFSLEKVQSGKYCFSQLPDKCKIAFATAQFSRRNHTWKEISQMPKHGYGTEKIPKNQIKATIPSFITPEVKDFQVLRYHENRPMVGYRKRDVFYILWFDHNYSLYDHG